MTNKELLELAAKAARMIFLTNGQACHPEEGNIDWNPLTDDGDALRLAVKLKLFVKVFPALDDEDDHYPSFAEAWQTESENPLWIEYEVTDPYAATRRAIVRAAAEIGKEMK